MAEPREVVIGLPAGLPLLSLNGRLHWAARNRIVQQLKSAAFVMARAAKAPPLQRAEVTVTYEPPDRRRRDPDNLAPTGKAAIDGLVLAGVLPDDSAAHVAGVRYQIGPPHPRGRVIIRVLEIQEQP